VEFKEFGWFGFRTVIPRSWSLSAEKTEQKSSYIRLEDERSLRMEVRWERSNSRIPPSGSMLLYRFKKTVASSSKYKFPFQIFRKGELKVNDHRAYYEVWKEGGSSRLILAWYCGAEKRSFILSLFLPDGEAFSDYREIIENFVCNPFNRFYKLTFLDVAVDFPVDFYPYSRKFLVGNSYICLRSDFDFIFFEWFSIFSHLIKNYNFSLKQFYKKFLRREIFRNFKRFECIPSFKGNYFTFDCSYGLLRKRFVYGYGWYEKEFDKFFLIISDFSKKIINIKDLTDHIKESVKIVI